MQGFIDYPLKPAFTWGNRPGFRAVALTMDASMRGCGAVIFIFWSGNNPVKYTDPDGKNPWPFEFSFDLVTDIVNFFSQFDPSLKLGNLLNAASHGDRAAQTYASYIIHEAGRDVLKQISSTSSIVGLGFLAVAAPEAAGIASGVGMLADIGLSVDDALSGNYKDVAIGGIMIVTGIGISKAVSSGLDSLVEKGINISVGKNGRYYSAGHRGALNTWDATQTLLKADIAAGKFGEIAPEAASQLLNLTKKAFDVLPD
jgi:hypothetical protein